MKWALLIMLCATSLWGQSPRLPDTPDRTAFFGSGAREHLSSLALSTSGHVAAVGRTSKGGSGGADIYFLLLNTKLEKLAERSIGRNRDDGAHHIATRPDGGFLVSGYSEAPPDRFPQAKRYFGGRDGWLLWLDEKGNTEAEFLLGGDQEDELVQAIPLVDGGTLAVGRSNGHAWALRLDAQRSIVWEKKWRYKQWPVEIQTAVLGADGRLYVGGHATLQQTPCAWVAALSEQGDLVMETVFDPATASTCHSLHQTDAGTLVFAGEVSSPRQRGDGVFCKIDLRGNLLSRTAFGGREPDRVLAMKADYFGGFVLAGESYSFERGARRTKGWVVSLDADGQFMEERFYGSKLDETARALLQLPNGDWLCAGTSGKQVLNTDQAWVIKLDERGRKGKKAKVLNTQPLATVYPNGVFLQAGERAFVPLAYRTEESGLKNIKALVRRQDAGPDSTETLALGTLAAQQQGWWGIPFHFDEHQPAGTAQYELLLLAGQDTLSQPVRFSVRFGKKAEPALSLAAAPVLESTATGTPSASLPIVIANLGDTIARALTLFVGTDDCLVAQEEIYLGDLPPGSKLNYRLPVQLAAGCLAPASLLKLRVADATLAHTAAQELAIQLADMGAPAVAAPPPARSFVITTWISPNPDGFEHSEIVWHSRDIEIQIKIVSSHEIGRQHFCLSINGRECDTGAKFEEVSMKGSAKSKTFSAKVALEEGVNTLKAIVQNEAGQAASETLRILYAPSRPNLHILSIGVPSFDLKYTTKDAKDFATVIGQSAAENRAFQHVFIDTLAGEEKTTKTAILKSLRRLQYRNTDRQIKPQDVLIVFISSHGMSTAEGRFRIAASDFDNPFMRETSLDFEHEIVDYLKDINCQKLYFIDACHSGAAHNGSNARSLSELATRQRTNLNLLLSCQADEYSYEDDKWQNGAFTKAMLRTIENFRARSADSPDLNGDNILDLHELQQSLSRMVPALVGSKKPKAETTQRPMLSASGASQKIALFSLSN